MEQYLSLVDAVLSEGVHKSNRTGVDTISSFSQTYEVALADGFPLLTTKEMSTFRWKSMLYELIWYLSGEEHIRNLREQTGIWDAWADDEGHLDTAYGRFWRRYPIPDSDGRLDGETWATEENDWVNDEGTFDQIQYVIDQLEANPNSRRLVVNAWHPANASVSTLPPCHYTYVFSVQGDTLNLHLHQRSGDVALGIPFNVAAYSLLLTLVAEQTGFEPGTFAHTIVDAHVYCGRGERGDWYADHLAALQARLADVESKAGYRAVRDWLVESTPPEADGKTNEDHVPNLLEQLAREPKQLPEITVADTTLDDLAFEDVELSGYDSHPGLDFRVAE
jgi:thymidylate synthase